ncbi:PREDICTED: BBSome-interacting protein 1-like [Dipodomys ordii]|uniref:BBSome-interacting protein 1-like n=1 Tax=Dipodomys ordii TaxID=10020 RepID=A0A1S3GIG2_DIPOR|nr:PREDICTED: BBSome-interacting protein 1-like [Dipodomys ordii]
MVEVKSVFPEVHPKQKQLSVENVIMMVPCKSRIVSLKSLTQEKLEKTQQAAENTIKKKEMAVKEQGQITH